MALADRILQLKLISDVKGAQKGMSTVQKDMTRVQKAQSKVTSGFKTMGTALVALGGITIAADFIGGAVNEFLEGEKAAKDFERQIKGTSKDVPADLRRMSAAMDDAINVGVGDDDFQRMVTDIIRRLRVDVPAGIRRGKLAIDLAAAGLFGTPEEASTTLIKALDGSKKALDKLGVPMRARKSDALILAFLEKKYGDAAEDNANTLPGRWKVIQEKFHQFQGDMAATAVQIADDMVANLGPEGVGGTIDGMSAVIDVALIEVKDSLTRESAPIIAEAARIGLSINAGITNAQGTGGIVGDVIIMGQGIVAALVGKQEPIREASQGVADAIRVPIVNTLAVIEERAETTTDNMISALDRMKAKLAAAKNLPPGILRDIFLGFPKLGDGGIVTRPTLAVVGERGPEAVIPLGGAGMGGVGGITINVHTGVGDPVEIGRAVDRVLRAYRGRAGVAA